MSLWIFTSRGKKTDNLDRMTTQSDGCCFPKPGGEYHAKMAPQLESHQTLTQNPKDIREKLKLLYTSAPESNEYYTKTKRKNKSS